jgi:hypothetical protein
MDLSFLTPQAQVIISAGGFCLVFLIVILTATGKLKIKKTKDEFILGDNTPFEKTNQRFKQLCMDVHETVSVTKEVNERALRMELDILKLKVTNENLPPSERLKSYEAYKKLGGNGWMEVYAQKVLLPLIENDVANVS